ncbi:MAG: quinone-dependent dihydroorotate dehydrogenase [Saccharospirillum sp.]
MYDVLRRGLFLLSPETAHDLSLDSLGALNRLGALSWMRPVVSAKPVNCFGLTFDNPVGLAAGLDKNADYLDALGALGFGFVEVGTVTPRPQPGNPRPRMFRVPESQAIINRMGFNNKGVDYLVARVRQSRYPGVIGINIGKNKDTAESDALSDYLHCLNKVYEHAHYVVINLSSPNTPGLRDLQFGDALSQLLEGLKERQHQLAGGGLKKPILIKIAPDLSDDEVHKVASVFNRFEVDGVIATNTTVSREAIANESVAREAGGLSGAPLRSRATRVLRQFRSELRPGTPLIGVGGIVYGEDAVEKVEAGANLVQLYTGFIYRGPRLIRDCVAALNKKAD